MTDIEADLMYANARIKELEAENEKLKEAQRWIPVEEKLPDFNDKSYHPIAHNCFVRDMHNNYASAIFYQPVTDKCDPWITSDEDIDTILITHWMPLPEPPEPEKPTHKRGICSPTKLPCSECMPTTCDCETKEE